MTQNERRIFLIEYLLSEYDDEEKIRLNYASFGSDSGQNLVSNRRSRQIPQDETEQKILLRGLMNIREPKPISEEFLKVQDEYLTERKLEKGIVKMEEIKNSFAVIKELPATSAPVPCILLPYPCLFWKGDITRLEVDAIVNAANSGMTGCYQPNHACIDNAIHTFAGVQLRLECARIMHKQGHPEPTGLAKITPAYNLPSKNVVHTVGPIVQGKLNERHELALKSCYKNCLEVAVKNGCKSIAFCCISTGVFMFPKKRAAKIAIETFREFLEETGSNIEVVFNVFGDEDFEIYRKYFDVMSSVSRDI